MVTTLHILRTRAFSDIGELLDFAESLPGRAPVVEVARGEARTVRDNSVVASELVI